MEFLKQSAIDFIRWIVLFITAIIGTIITIWPLIAIGAIVFIIVKVRKKRKDKEEE